MNQNKNGSIPFADEENFLENGFYMVFIKLTSELRFK